MITISEIRFDALFLGDVMANSNPLRESDAGPAAHGAVALSVTNEHTSMTDKYRESRELDTRWARLTRPRAKSQR